MTFQEIDYPVLLFKAYLEPVEVRFEYLDLAREKTGYSEKAFLAKLDQALKTLKSAFEDSVNDHKWRLQSNLTNLGIPISSFNRYQGLQNFSASFQGRLSGGLLENIDSFLLGYKFKLVDQLFEKKIQELEKSPISESTLKGIWMERPQKTIEEVLEKGFVLGLWDKNGRLQAQRSGPYGSGKLLLANLYIALKGNSVKNEIDYKEVGKILCDFFGAEIGVAKEPFKSFQSGNQKKIDLIKKDFKFF